MADTEGLKTVYVIPQKTDLNHHFNESDLNGMKHALDCIGMPEIFDIFVEQMVDFEVFKELDNETISKLLASYPLGIIRKFQIRYAKWQKSIDTEATETVFSGIVRKFFSKDTEHHSFFDSIDPQNPLSVDERKALRSRVLGHFFQSQQKLTSSDIQRLAEDIVICFPKENIAHYFDPKTKSGPLYNEFNNLLEINQ